LKLNNQTDYSSRELRSIICKVHAFMKKLEGKPAPRWKRLNIRISYTKSGHDVGGFAYYGGFNYGDQGEAVSLRFRHKDYFSRGQGDGWTKVFDKEANGWRWEPGKFTKDADGRSTLHSAVRLVYHELMHTYGYKHSQYEDIRPDEVLKLYPENKLLDWAEPEKRIETLDEKVIKKVAALKARERSWNTKAKRAATAQKQIAKKLKYYSKTYPDLVQ